MIELLFSDGACACLKIAQLTWENAVSIDGNSADIFGLNLSLSIGNINEGYTSANHQIAQKLLKKAAENLEAIHRRIKAGQAVRIWYSNHPDEMCGLYWFMFQLKLWGINDVQIFTVKLPEWRICDKSIIQNCSWGEVAPEQWHHYLSLQNTLPMPLIKSYSSRWNELQNENAPLRAVLNGQLVSALETLYDDFIIREISAECDEFNEANIIGRVLGKYQLGIGDAWVALRIEEMIQAGKLKVISAAVENMPTYHRMLKKC